MKFIKCKNKLHHNESKKMMYQLIKFSNSLGAKFNNVRGRIKNSYIIEVNGARIGSICFCVEDGLLLVWGFYIKEKYRGNGYGKQAIKKLLKEHDNVLLEVLKTNTVAYNMYTSLGFKKSHCNCLHDTLCYKKCEVV